MGSRPEINLFIEKMTETNTVRLSKLNDKKDIFNEDYGPLALCNRKLVSKTEQEQAQLKAYIELIHYVAKVSFQQYFGSSKVYCAVLRK